MSTLKNQLYKEAANKSLIKLRSEWEEKHTSKKEHRFSVKNITYEVGVAESDNEGISFEISSKIPIDQLPENFSREEYFGLVKNSVYENEKHPLSMEMDNIVTNPNLFERKERDYVKVEYRYSDNELYRDDEIALNVKNFNEDSKDLPKVPGINSIFGRLVLLKVEESMFTYAQKNLEQLVAINSNVLEEILKR